MTTPGGSQALATPSVTLTAQSSAQGTLYSEDNWTGQDHFTGTNTVNLRLPDMGDAPVRIVLDYTSTAKS